MFHRFIGDYRGQYGEGSAVNRFWPALGNHDWVQEEDYERYFTLPGNERYYDVDLGLVHLFVLDSDPREPDGISVNSVQAQWLAERLELSTAPHNFVVSHHPPYSSGDKHGSSFPMQWGFAGLGVTTVLSGHEHSYERLAVEGVDYVVNGAGGRGLYGFVDPPLAGSAARVDREFGVTRVLVAERTVIYEFWSIDGRRLDRFVRGEVPPAM